MRLWDVVACVLLWVPWLRLQGVWGRGRCGSGVCLDDLCVGGCPGKRRGFAWGPWKRGIARDALGYMGPHGARWGLMGRMWGGKGRVCLRLDGGEPCGEPSGGALGSAWWPRFSWLRGVPSCGRPCGEASRLS